MDVYGTPEGFRVWDGLPVDGSLDPSGLERGLIHGTRLLNNKPQVQAKYVLDNFPEVADIDPHPYEEANYALVSYWAEIGGGRRVDLSQNTLRPKGGYSRIGSVSIPQYVPFAPVAIEVLRAAGLWFPFPDTIDEKVRRLVG